MPRTGDTVRDFVQTLFPGWGARDWLYWPPDCFAVTSILLRQTGCYRYVVDPEYHERRPLEWQSSVERAAGEWIAVVAGILQRGGDTGAAELERHLARAADGIGLLRDTLGEIEELGARVRMTELRILSDEASRKLCAALITLHAIADEACSGFGLVAGCRPENALAHYLGNLLLIASGSLSTLPKHHGIVLPKMRTPQSGLTQRSMSHHLTYHNTEVEVMWRSIPWANIDENTINVLAVPWPARVDIRSFRSTAETFESVRYFRYEPDRARDGDGPRPDPRARMEKVVSLIRRLNDDVGRVHMVVFPELALSREEYEALMWELWKLHDELGPSGRCHIPMIIAGVKDSEGCEALNEVRLGAFFAGRWYDLSQHKHHRWRLTRPQVLQYGLQGGLPTTRNWYEKIPVVQRRLTFLVPNGWLSVCPLICEDLARLEPVSEVIRGVGPTLLTALLMDGPQLKERWPARYASVLAEDPGTAVLSLTSLGMVEQSRPVDKPAGAPKDSRTVGLWTDQVTQWATLDLPPDRGAALLTLSADQVEEFSADGRTDHRHAASFKFEGVTYQELSDPRSDGAAGPPAAGAVAAEGAGASDGGGDAERRRREKEKWLGKWDDIRELSAATFALDALVTVRGRHSQLIGDWLVAGRATSSGLPARYQEILESIFEAQSSPRAAGIRTYADRAEPAERKEDWPSEALCAAIAEMHRWFDHSAAPEGSAILYWDLLADQAIEFLRDESHPPLPLHDEGWVTRRTLRSVRIALLAILHSRLERERRRVPLPHGIHPDAAGGDAPTAEIRSRLLNKIEKELVKHL